MIRVCPWDCTCNLCSGLLNGRHGKGIHFVCFLPAAEAFFHLVQFSRSQLLLENKSKWTSWQQHEEGLWFHPFHNTCSSSGRSLQGAAGFSVSASVVCSCFCYWNITGKTGIKWLSPFWTRINLGNTWNLVFSFFPSRSGSVYFVFLSYRLSFIKMEYRRDSTPYLSSS